MGILNDYGIVTGRDNKAAKIFEGLHQDFRSVSYEKPSEYVSKYWGVYKKTNGSNSAVNGKVFEYILATLLIREGLKPIFLDAEVTFVHNVIYDIMLFSKERGPLCISAKTSLRERWKQADLEAMALKNVYRRAKCFLITLPIDEQNIKDARNVKVKIESHEVFGLDDVLLATESSFDKLLSELRDYTLTEPNPVAVFRSTKVVPKEPT
jgi:hypothetical protein